MKKRLYTFFAIILLVIVTLIPLNGVFKRKSAVEPFNNQARISSLYELPSESIDIAFVGSSHAYTSINPNILYELYGIKSFVMASQQQSIAMSYYHIEEVLRFQKPKMIVLNTYMFNNTHEFSDSIASDAIEFMKMSSNKFRMIRDLVPYDNQISYFIPFTKYHSRWNELKKNDFKYAFKSPESNTLGFVPLATSEIVDRKIGERVFVENYNTILNAQDMEYLDKIIALCMDSNIELVLYNAPYNIDDQSNNITSAIETMAEDRGIGYFDFSRMHDLIGIDYENDFFDSSHLNKYGAAKFTKKFGEMLLQDYGSSIQFDLNENIYFSDKVKLYNQLYE